MWFECGKSWKAGCKNVRKKEKRKEADEQGFFSSISGFRMKSLKNEYIMLMLRH